jgi:hypothetical protein
MKQVRLSLTLPWDLFVALRDAAEDQEGTLSQALEGWMRTTPKTGTTPVDEPRTQVSEERRKR